MLHDTQAPAKAKAIAGPSPRVRQRPPFERIALLLQGRGALGANPTGVYEHGRQ